jgi:hypothetical protein
MSTGGDSVYLQATSLRDVCLFKNKGTFSFLHNCSKYLLFDHDIGVMTCVSLSVRKYPVFIFSLDVNYSQLIQND